MAAANLPSNKRERKNGRKAWQKCGVAAWRMAACLMACWRKQTGRHRMLVAGDQIIAVANKPLSSRHLRHRAAGDITRA